MKKILIFTAGYGEGHNTAARNLKAGLEYTGGENVNVEIVDIFSMAHPKFNDFMRKLYVSAINKTPKIWSRFYKMLDETPAVGKNMWMFAKCIEALERVMLEKQPDTVCSTYPLYAHFFGRLKANSKIKPFRLVTIVTDSITVNSLWYRAESDDIIVPNEDSAQVVEKGGVPRGKIRVLGFPVQLDFALPERRATIAAPDVSNPPAILYIINSGKQNAPQIVSELLENPTWKLSVAVGKDEKLRAMVEHKIRGNEHRTQIIGWTSEMPRLMMTHHLIISKAGGATVQETLAAQTPMIVNQVVPGQEEGNYLLLQRNECGILAETTDAIPRLVRDIFANDSALWRTWKENLKKLHLPDSAIQISKFLLS